MKEIIFQNLFWSILTNYFDKLDNYPSSQCHHFLITMISAWFSSYEPETVEEMTEIILIEGRGVLTFRGKRRDERDLE